MDTSFDVYNIYTYANFEVLYEVLESSIAYDGPAATKIMQCFYDTYGNIVLKGLLWETSEGGRPEDQLHGQRSGGPLGGYNTRQGGRVRHGQ